MNISKAETLIPQVLDNFSDFTGEAFASRVFLFAKDETGEERRQIYEELGAKFEPYVEGSISETVVGEKGIAIFIYPFNVFNARDFAHSLLHECGHVYFRKHNEQLAEAYIKGTLSDSAHMGFSLFEEFIAEVLANFAENDAALFDEEYRRAQLVHLLYSAIPGINREPTKQAMEESLTFMRSCVYVLPGVLGRYAAMKLTDPTIKRLLSADPGCDTGLAACGKDAGAEVKAITEMLNAYLDSYSEKAYTDIPMLEALGKRLINIWNIRAKLKNRK